jgi:hypothetical protein
MLSTRLSGSNDKEGIHELSLWSYLQRKIGSWGDILIKKIVYAENGQGC